MEMPTQPLTFHKTTAVGRSEPIEGNEMFLRQMNTWHDLVSNREAKIDRDFNREMEKRAGTLMKTTRLAFSIKNMQFGD